MEIGSMLQTRGGYYVSSDIEAEKSGKKEINSRFSSLMDKEPIPQKGKGAPYSYLADENGEINYNGVIFHCDNERQRLCLGDVTNPDQVIQIPLSEGGCLVVNRENIDQLAGCIGMFSPEDVNLILRALRMDAKIQEMKKELEDMESGDSKSVEATIKQLEKAERAEVCERIRNGKKETSFLTGGSAFTETEWTDLIDCIDHTLDGIKQGLEEENDRKENDLEKDVLEELLKERTAMNPEPALG